MFFISGGNGGGSYYNQSSPNEDGGGYYGPSSGSPRDLSYYGYNNGFGGGGDSSGNAFYHQPASSAAQQGDNNNKVSLSSLSSGDATSAATAAASEFQHGDTIKNEQPTTHEVPPSSSSGGQESKDSETCSVTTVTAEHMDPSISDMNNSDNQKPRSQSSPIIEQNSPRTLPGQLLRRSPASHESSEFEQQPPPHSFDQQALMTSHPPDEYMRQMSAMGSQSEGKETLHVNEYRMDENAHWSAPCYFCSNA